jgi:hypothetical protein
MCPEGTYTDNEWQVCRKCDIACPVCWGPFSDMCGTTVGIKTTAVLLENEIRIYFQHEMFSSQNISKWLSGLAVILHNVKGEDKFNKMDILSPDDVYGTDKMLVDLPIGSFSGNNGVFIPIPSYLNENMEMVNSHWVNVGGMWNGRSWSDNWFPNVPSYIKNKGIKDKIYYENGGYWIYNSLNNGFIF